jgi:hypothetical protein
MEAYDVVAAASVDGDDEIFFIAVEFLFFVVVEFFFAVEFLFFVAVEFFGCHGILFFVAVEFLFLVVKD